MNPKFDVAIIGGGASGLTAAIQVKRKNPELSVVILEKKEKVGKKLSAAGNGRCNLSNSSADGFNSVIQFFGEVGIALRKDESGRIYPYSEDGAQVTRVLETNVLGLGVTICLNTSVNRMEVGPEGGFLLFVCENFDKGMKKDFQEKVIFAKKVLLATGGKSYASMGTTGDGFIMARKSGHSVTPLAPGLTGIEVLEKTDSLKGVRVKGTATILHGEDVISKEEGEMQFRNGSVSGICIMNLSNFIKPGRGSDGKLNFDGYKLSIDLTCDYDCTELINLLSQRKKLPGYKAENLLETLVKGKIGREILRRADVLPESPAELLDNKKIKKIAELLKSFCFHISGLSGWNEAQITIGGVDMSEVNPKTMESRLICGLYFSGEVLDYAGPCGGYNLNNAFLTGIKAGESMAIEEGAVKA